MLVGGARPWNQNTLLQEIVCVSWLDPHYSSTKAHPLGHGAAISLTALWSFLRSPSTNDKIVTDLLAGWVTDEEPRLFGASREFLTRKWWDDNFSWLLGRLALPWAAGVEQVSKVVQIFPSFIPPSKAEWQTLRGRRRTSAYVCMSLRLDRILQRTNTHR